MNLDGTCIVLLLSTFNNTVSQNQHTVELFSEYATQVQQQRSKSPTVTLTWHACKYKVHKLHQRYILIYVPCIYTHAR